MATCHNDGIDPGLNALEEGEAEADLLPVSTRMTTATTNETPRADRTSLWPNASTREAREATMKNVTAILSTIDSHPVADEGERTESCSATLTHVR